MATGYYANETFKAILEYADEFDLTPQPDWREQLPPETPAPSPPTITGIPVPVAPPFSDDYSSVAEPSFEFPIIQTATGDSVKLGNNMIEAGFDRPAETSAHHIVPSGDRRGATTRAVLAQAGIGINDAGNGVFLPTNLTSDNPNDMDVHSKINTRRYYENLNARLSGLTDRQEILDALNTIRQELQNGTFPY